MMLSVIVPSFNAADTISGQLEALANQQWNQPWEVIVADNGSSDQTVAIRKASSLRLIAQKYSTKIPSLRVIDASDKKGAAHARNVGASVAKGEALAFCDADDEVAPGWVAAMGEALSKYDFVAGRNQHWKLNEPWLVKSYRVENGDGIAFDHPYLPVVGGNNIGIKRSVHEAVGGFDETFLAIEDIDYCWRVQQTGAKLHEVPEAILNYRFRTSIMGGCSRSWSVGFYEPLLYQKHQSLGLPKLMSWKIWVKTALNLCLNVLRLKIRDKASLAGELRHLAWNIGQIQGCIKYRYFPV